VEQDLIMLNESGHLVKSLPQTERLSFRELVPSDNEPLFDLLGDAEAMQFYRQTFSPQDVDLWIARNLRRYRIFGYGLWAVLDRNTGELFGDCGLTWHEVGDELLLEVGYHFRRRYWGNGFATEAARASIQWCFDNTAADEVISIIDPQNIASRNVAERNGLEILGKTTRRGCEHLVYMMERKRWQSRETQP
jgi:RimJ/RimL family protein N-acetyltransferase